MHQITEDILDGLDRYERFNQLYYIVYSGGHYSPLPNPLKVLIAGHNHIIDRHSAEQIFNIIEERGMFVSSHNVRIGTNLQALRDYHG